MTQKFGRAYKLTIWPLDGGDPIIIQLPFTIKINCLRSLNGGVNQLSVDVFNLSNTNRKRIYQDKNVLGQLFNAQTPAGATITYLNILLEAGYGNQLHRIFYGHMLWADSVRDGTNIVTHIEAQSMLFDLVSTQVQVTLPAPITAAEILTYLIGQFPNLKIGAIGNFPTSFNRPVVLNGMAWDLIKIYSLGGTAFIDDGKVYVLNNNEVTGSVFLVNDNTGILQTPCREQSLLIVKTLMETGVQLIGQMIQIQSTIAPQYNGIYKVLGVQHQGTISAAVCEKMISIFSLQAAGLYNGAPGSIPPNQQFTVIPFAQSAS